MSDEQEPLGCGKKKIFFFQGFFTNDCAKHDVAYDTLKETDDTEPADREFLSDMLKRAGKNPFRIIQAIIMFTVARIYGEAREEIANKKQEEKK